MSQGTPHTRDEALRALAEQASEFASGRALTSDEPLAQRFSRACALLAKVQSEILAADVERQAAALAAPRQQAEADGEYEVWQDGMNVAGASGPGAHSEAMHYAMQYAADGPVRVERITRTVVCELTPPTRRVE